MGMRSRLLENSKIYEIFQSGIGKSTTSLWILSDVVAARPDDRVLDIGCGPAKIAAHFQASTYVGIDHNQRYIDKARERFGAFAQFHCWDVSDPRVSDLGKFDIVLLLGVLHHLPDESVLSVMKHAKGALAKGGRLVTLDPAFDAGQHPIARLLAGLDRGRYVRTIDRYRQLISSHFVPEQVMVRHDLLRVPYTHSIIRAFPHSDDGGLTN
jgi:SAM-dependent methyltransferase